MANVVITVTTGGICQYCAEKPATRLVNGEWKACKVCAIRVASGAEDVGYEAYCSVSELKSNGINWCSECEREIEACSCIEQDLAEAHARDLPLVPPTRPAKELRKLRQREKEIGRLRAMRQAFRDRPSPGGRGAVAFWLGLAAFWRTQDRNEWEFAIEQARTIGANLTVLGAGRGY